MRRILLLVTFAAALLSAAPVRAASSTLPADAGFVDPDVLQLGQDASGQVADEYRRATVTEVTKDETKDAGGTPFPYQLLVVRLDDGADAGKTVTVENGGAYSIREEQRVNVGDRVVVVKTMAFDEATWYVSDRYRIPALEIVFLFFLVCAAVFGRWRGITAVLGLAATVGVLVLWVVPRILGGADPFVTSIIGAAGIAVLSMYLAHGVNKRTTVALGSTLLALGLSAGFATAFVAFTHLLGTGSEDAYYIRLASGQNLDFRGLLLAGIMIGALGVLDDVTSAQTASVDEIRDAAPHLPSRELWRRGLSVGREHIASLVNTLFLAYAGESLALFLLIPSDASRPLWVILNGENIATEIVRTLVGSVTLVLAVPIATALAAWLLPLWKRNDPPHASGPGHHH